MSQSGYRNYKPVFAKRNQVAPAGNRRPARPVKRSKPVVSSHTEKTLKYYTPLQSARVRKKIRQAKRKSKKAVNELVSTLVGDANVSGEDAVRRAYNMVDINGDNEIQLKEFMTAMRDHLGLKY